METGDLIKPKEFTVTDDDGKQRAFIISKFDAVSGREIVAKYTLSNLPRIGDYAVSEETMFKLMSYVAVSMPNGPLRLSTRALVNNHVGDWEVLAEIEQEMMRYNCRFFRNGRLSSFFEDIAQKLLQRIFEISTPSSAQSSQAEKPPFTSSEPSTP